MISKKEREEVLAGIPSNMRASFDKLITLIEKKLDNPFQKKEKSENNTKNKKN